jgi:hypothetical protein
MRSQAGVTLIEATLALAIGSVIIVALSSLIIVAGRAQALSQDVTEVADAGALASERLATDLREMAAPPAAAIKLIAAGELQFDTVQEPAVHYRVVAGKLMRGTSVLAHGVSSFSLRYYRADGTEIVGAIDPNFARRIRYGFDVTRGDATVRFESGIYPRALNPIAPAWEEQP